MEAKDTQLLSRSAYNVTNLTSIDNTDGGVDSPLSLSCN